MPKHCLLLGFSIMGGDNREMEAGVKLLICEGG
jgi:hypothetical protein